MEAKKSSIEEALKSSATNQKTFEKAERSKPGRKSKSEDKKIKHPITLYFNKEDFEFLSKLAEQDEDTPQKFCKKIVTRFLKQAKNKL